MTDLPNYNYPPGTLILIDGRPHKWLGMPIPGRIHLMCCTSAQPFVCPDATGEVGMPTPDIYDQLSIDGRIEIQLPANVVASRKLAATAEWDIEDCEKLDPKVGAMLAQCVVLDTNGVKNGIKAVTAGLQKYWTGDLVERFGEADNPHTVKRWRSERGEPGARTHKQMVRLNGKVPRAPYLADVPEEIKQKHALATVSVKGTMRTGYAEAATELRQVNAGESPRYAKPEKPYPIFSYDTFRRACIALEGSEAVGARDGKDMVEGTMRGAGKPLTASRILEKVIIDHTPLSTFLVVDPERDVVAGKPWITVAFDVHSRVALGWVITFRPPSYWTVCEVLRRMNLPKRPPPLDAERYPILKRLCGRPGEAILDNAEEFTCHSLEDAAKGSGISVRFCPIKQPRYRAIGERGLGSIERKMLEHLPGQSFTIEYSRKTGHNGEDRACVTPNELEALANKAFAEYHTEPHDGLDDRQPALVFQKSANKHGIDVMGDVRRFRLETCEVQHNVQITKSGARMFGGLRYHCVRGVPRLIDNNLRYEPRRQPRVDATIHTKVKYDPENIAVVHAFDRTTNSYVELRCQDETYADGMPLWFHEDLRDIAKQEATAEPDATAKRRAKRTPPKERTLQPLSSLDTDEEQPIKGFNTEAERLEARTRRIQAIRAIAPNARHRQRLTLARLYETPRLRQITGNIVHLDTDYAKPVTIDDFISHDVAALTALDAEIMAPRPPIPPTRKERTGTADSRRAGQWREQPQAEEPEAPRRRSSRLS